MDDNFAEIFWVLIMIAAVAGWASIEGLIWIFGHIDLQWI